MCSFGEGVSMTPLQLGAMVSAIANGGTLYYLQHPNTPEDIANFQPICETPSGHCTADSRNFRRDGGSSCLRYRAQPANQFQRGRNSGQDRDTALALALASDGLLPTPIPMQAASSSSSSSRGGRPTFGPKAAEITGHIYRNLYDHDFFVAKPAAPADTAAVKTLGSGQ